MKKSLILYAILLIFGISGFAHAALLTFDDAIAGATSYSFDGDGDSTDDVIFTTSDPSGFNTAGPGANMTYINEPGLEGTSLLPIDLRVDFLVGAISNLSFGFSLDSETEDDTASFYIYDSGDNLLASSTQTGLYTFPAGRSNYPEGYLSLDFTGTASYAAFNFTSDFGRYIIDNFQGTFGSSEVPVPEPATMLLLASGLVGLAGVGRKRLFKK